MNQDTFGIIARFAGEFWTLQVLRRHLCPKVFESFYTPYKKLIYGEVQSGKTAKIIEEVRNSPLPVVLVIQNSRLVLKQYVDRLRDASVPFQVVQKNTTVLTARVIVLLNNKNQFAKYMALNPPKTYAILLDESDLTHHHPLRANAEIEIHVTATPFRYKPHTFDSIEFVEKRPDYYGLDKVRLRPISKEVNYLAIVAEFMASQGVLLINTFTRVEQMRTVAMTLSSTHPTVPVILLTTEKGVYLNRVFSRIRGNSLNRIMDQYANQSHVIIVANRMATRGISFSNSDHTTHITHQVSKPNTLTGFLQKCRILGVYPNLPELTLYIEEGFVWKIERYKQILADRNAILDYHQNKARKPFVYKSFL
jgi:hypothetical protein